jgi:sulfonate transport system substrate-binding protein
MTANVVTFHGDVADAVPIFSQAAGAALAYYAMEKGSPAAEALIVHDASPARSVADLRGRTVAVSKGSGAHYMLVGLLKRAGLAQGDVRIAFLEASLASAAFSTGTVDAWAIWDPYLAITEARTKVRVLGEGTGITSYNRYYLADAAFVRAHPEVVEIVYAALAGQAAAIRAQPQPYAAELSPYWDHVSPEIVARIDARRGYRIQPVDAAAMAEQQRIADLFVSMQLIPEAIRVAETPVWRPRSA